MKLKRYSILLFTLLISALLLSACSGSLAASSWPGVTVDQDTIYIAYAANVMAVRSSDGSLIWRYPEKADNRRQYYAAPVAAGDQLIVGDYLGTLHSLNIKTGTQNWEFAQTTGRFVGSVLVEGDTILAPSVDHTLYALDLSGKLLWKFTAGNGLWAHPVSDGSRVYLASMDHNMYAVDLKTGAKVWETDLGGSVVYAAALSPDGILYVGNLANQVIALKAQDGSVLWRYETQGAVWSRPVLNNGVVYFGDLKGTVYAVDAATGSARWQLDQVGTAVIAAVGLTPDGIIVVTEDGNLVSIDFNGQKQWTKTINGKLYTTPEVNGDHIIVAVTQGDSLLKSFTLQGAEQWSFVAPK